MRVSKRRALTVSALAGAALLWSGCEAKKQTEYVTGIATQVQVPRDLRSIRVEVNVAGVPQFCRTYAVYDGRVQLPRSLGQLPQSDTHLADPITVTVVGYTDADPNDDKCFQAIQVGTNARILRRSRQPYVKDKILFLPMALRFSCFDKDCETSDQTKTCKAGKCVDAATDERQLPEFSDDLLDGRGGACFNVASCMLAAGPPAVVNPDDCTYALPNTASAPDVLPGLPPNPVNAPDPTFPRDGINVRVVYDGGYNAEILDLDADEGFTVPDPAKPQRFRLSPGLCEMVKGYDADGKPVAHRITGVFASGTCQAKGKFQPLCANDMLQAMGADPTTGISKSASISLACNPIALKPPKSELMILVDGTQSHMNFFKDKVQAAGVSLADPAFEMTDLGLMFFPGKSACSGGAAPAGGFAPDIPLTNARKASLKTDFSSAFTQKALSLAPFGTPTDMDGVLASAYATLKGTTAYRRAVLLFGNHNFLSQTCGTKTPADLAHDAVTDATAPVETYVVMVTSDQDPAAAPKDQVFGEAFPIAQNGTPPGDTPRAPYDARDDDAAAQQAFRDVVNNLATCVYDVASPLDENKVLTYTDPVTGATAQIAAAQAGTCTDPKGAGNGWGQSGGRVYLCGKACSDYRGVLQIAAAYAAQYKEPALAVPMFAHDKGCAPDAGGNPSGQTLPGVSP
jgi:hypothetical protein